MSEAVEDATTTQLALHRRHREIHRKFFPRPPVFPVILIEPAKPEPLAKPPSTVQSAAPVNNIGPEQTRLRMRIIRHVVCINFGISKESLMSDRRSHAIVLPRHVFSYLASTMTRASLPMIARMLLQDHTTIMHAIRRMRKKLDTNCEFAERVRHIKARVADEFGDHERSHNCIARYVAHGRVADYFPLGWMWAANMNDCAALLIWPCGCQCVEPQL